ncbi:MAG: hypothetical protein UT55_C0016G0002 [Candidatus Peregrinibacteria bacterium GW2011_GWE2_39_6]|nr:MAG: hypothetical protein UT36_C0003G0118 [Candidatus Peregrinibacteria bacterium GW2011_GWF2_39_17]KKR26141.1 MAG: hypothetical protein UT55_C0016G0002 [Candidatus Peregrinibacteria bacterium GW2011_GWE2_39_6]HCW32331.1 hypothetical protein [Candidatus Peregrinibacteria bacterium]
MSEQTQLAQLFREIEIDLGATELSFMAITAFKQAVTDLKGQNLHAFFEQLLSLKQNIEVTKPKFAIIIDAFYEILELAYDEEIHHPESNFPLKKQKFIQKLDKMLLGKKQEGKQLLEYGAQMEIEGKEILVHDNSHTVQNVLARLKQDGKHFRVLVAEQDPDKTGAVIEFLHRKKIPFRVVPAYMITHLEDHIDMFFLGGVTLKSTMNFVMDPGTNGLAAQMHILKKPIYVFMATSKFSLWKANTQTEIHKHVMRQTHPCMSIDFERIKFSHDRVPLNLATKIITEEGIFTPKQLELLYKNKFKKRMAHINGLEKLLKAHFR